MLPVLLYNLSDIDTIMRSLSEAGVKLLSKIPKLPVEAEWLNVQVNKWAASCNKGYAKLQSGRISRGRLTMMDISDERETAAWTETVWQEGGIKEWPKALRPQRPEQLTLTNRCRQSQMRRPQKCPRTKLPANPDVDIFENPPVFLKIKDIKKNKDEMMGSCIIEEERPLSRPQSRADTPRFSRSRQSEVVGGVTKDDPIWPAALLTYDRGVSPVNMIMADDLELMGFKLSRDIRLCQEELFKKRKLVVELSKTQTSHLSEIEALSAKLKKSWGEVEEVKAQLQVRSEATQRLEQENASLRDTVARLQVQVDSNTLERERLLLRWQMAEGERVNWKEKCEKLQDAASESAAFKEQCLLLQNQLRNTVAKIVSQQEIVQQEYSKVERAAKDSIAFAKTVSSHTEQQEAEAKNILVVIEECEKKLIQLSAELTGARWERDQLIAAKNKNPDEEKNEYYIEWERYQQDVKKRIEGFMGENMRFQEELLLLRKKADSIICQKCEKNNEQIDVSTVS